HSQNREMDRMRFQAAIHGIDLDKETGVKKGSQQVPPTVKVKPMDGLKFGDPDSYKHLSQEKREELTQEMMGKHKAWNAAQKPMGGKKGREFPQ
ncbi:unnamed protein product, partial [marine sediment metagenome]